MKTIKLTLAAACAALMLATPAFAEKAKKFGLGREATKAEVKAWDIDVRPDGQGLPVGKGTASKGEEIFAEKCASCHGDFAEGVDRWPVLAGGRGTLAGHDPVKTVGSYWPYLSTVFDYIYRAMPYGDAQSLKPNELYSIVAYILHMNNIIEDPDFVLSNENFKTIKMPNAGNFIKDPRPDTATTKTKKPCMKNCKKDVKITMRARILDVTPKEGEEAPKGSLD